MAGHGAWLAVLFVLEEMFLFVLLVRRKHDVDHHPNLKMNRYTFEGGGGGGEG